MMQERPKKDTKQAPETQLRGWPGYRTRDNRSGLDPLDSRAEAAHVGGTLLRQVLTLRLRTRNPLALLMLFLLGVLPFIFLAYLIFGTLFSGNPFRGPLDGVSLPGLVLTFVFLLLTGALAVNFVLSIAGTGKKSR